MCSAQSDQLIWWPGKLTYTSKTTVSSDETDVQYHWVFTDQQGGVHRFTVVSEDMIGRQPPRFKHSTTVTGPSTDGLFELTAKGSTGTISALGWIRPKFIVNLIAYAPPGDSKNYVDYSNSIGLGSTSNWGISFASGTSESISMIAGDSEIVTTSVTTSGGICVTKSAAWDYKVNGTPNKTNTDGINHDNDVIWLILNPLVKVKFSPPNSAILEVTYDDSDIFTGGKADTQYIMVGQIRDPANFNPPIAPGTLVELERAWDKSDPNGASRAITSKDLANIIALDPYWNLGNNITVSTPIDKIRFQPVANCPTINYEASNVTETRTAVYTTVKQSSTETAFSDALSYTFGGKIGTLWGISNGGNSSITYKFSTSLSNSSGSGIGISITGPQPGYKGPTNINVYQDNIFGGLLFAYN